MLDKKRIIVALDFPTSKEALGLVDQLDAEKCRIKVGKELFTREGPVVVEKLQAKGFEVFLDLKFHDIPNTTAAACRAAAGLGVWMINVHTLGGRRMMEAARNAIDKSANQPLLIGVTVLTSMGGADLLEVGLSDKAESEVARLAQLAYESGLDGLVCSAQETSFLRNRYGTDFTLVTPGIRPVGSEVGDQRRTMTPLEAINAGSSYLVIGRPVTRAEKPTKMLNDIYSELDHLKA